jgi:probable HAF family extracellular repeat protein
MSKNMFCCLAALLLMICSEDSTGLMAQTDSGSSGAMNARRDFSPWPEPSLQPDATAQQTGETFADAVEMGMAKRKTYQFRTVDFPAAVSSILYDYNDGIAGGNYQFYGGGTQAFYFKGMVNTALNVPGSVSSFIEGINGSGQMVGQYFDSKNLSHGFLYIGKVVTQLDVPGASGWTEASDISDSGVIVGNFIDRKNRQHGFEDKNGMFTEVDYPGAQSTFAIGINASGEIVGIYTDSSARTHGFLLKNGTYSSIDFPSATDTRSFGINDAGEIAGTFHYQDGVRHGFTYSNAAFTKVDVDQAVGTALLRIKNNGNIVGWTQDGLHLSHGIIGK